MLVFGIQEFFVDLSHEITGHPLVVRSVIRIVWHQVRSDLEL